MRSEDDEDFIQKITEETFASVRQRPVESEKVVELSDYHLEKPNKNVLTHPAQPMESEEEIRVSWENLPADIKVLFHSCEVLYEGKILRVEYDRRKIDFPMSWSIFKNLGEDRLNKSTFSYYSLNDEGDVDFLYEILKDENDLEIGWISDNGGVYFGAFKKNDAIRLQKFKKLLRSHHLEELKVKNLKSAA